MVENKEPIVLDSTDNVFVGPNEYFKIVVDEIEGDAVKAWHLEDSLGNQTGNLVQGEGKHIDLLVNKDNRTVWHFGSRVAARLIAQNQAQIQQLQQKVAELEAQLEQ